MTTIRLPEATDAPDTISSLRGGFREWAPLAVLMIGTFMIVLDSTTA